MYIRRIRMGDREIENILNYNRKGYLIAGKKVYIYHPKQKDYLEAEEVYADHFNKLLLKGALTQKEILKELFRRGIFHPGKTFDTAEQEEAYDIWWDLYKKEYSETNEEIKAQLKPEVEKAKKELDRVNGEVYRYLSNSAEDRAEAEKRIVLLVRCAVDENGKPFWKSPEEYKNESDTVFALLVLNAALRFWAGINELPLGITSLDEATPNTESPKNSDNPSGESPSQDGALTESST